MIFHRKLNHVLITTKTKTMIKNINPLEELSIFIYGKGGGE